VTNDELNRAVAERIMGWTFTMDSRCRRAYVWAEGTANEGFHVRHADGWQPATNDAHAMKAMRAARDVGVYIRLSSYDNGYTAHYTGTAAAPVVPTIHTDPLASRAICLALLDAAGQETTTCHPTGSPN
jgi:hypothetical protein